MEEAEALGIVDRLYDALGAFYSGGDETPVRELLADDVEWHVPGGSPIAGDYQGIDQVVAYFNTRRGLARGTYRMILGEILVGEEHVAVLTDGTAAVGGIQGGWTTLGLYRIHDGAVAGCWLLPLDQTAFDAIWSTEA